MKHALLFFFICFLGNSAFAGHNIAGTITYKHLGGLTYEASIITYTETAGSSILLDRTSLDLSWGDGASTTLQRVSAQVIEGTIQKNVYKGTHTYSSNGSYILSMTDMGKRDAILNIEGGAYVALPFYLEAKLVANGSLQNNASEFLAPPIFKATVGQVYKIAFPVMDADGDEVSYELITPFSGNGTFISGYQLVTDVNPGVHNTYTFDAQNGVFTWDAPQQPGLYNVAMMVKECRDGQEAGYTIIDFQIQVISIANEIRSLMELGTWPTPTSNGIQLNPNNSLQLSMYSNQMATDSVKIEAYGAAFLTNPPPQFTTDSTTSTYLEKTFEWTPSSAIARCQPYTILFRHSVFRGGHKFSVDKIERIVVRDSSMANCDSVQCVIQPNATVNRVRPSLNVQISPNPFSNVTTLSWTGLEEVCDVTLYNLQGQTVYRKKDVLDSIVTIERRGLPAGIYFYSIEHQSKILAQGKLIVKDE